MWRSNDVSQTAAYTASQLPVWAYFNEAVLEAEATEVFGSRPQYAGHELMVPKVHDFCVLPQHEDGMVIVRNADGVEVLSNVCRHRQATILNGRGNAQRISCPMHRWTYDTKGALVTAPRFKQNPCLNLERFPTQTWRGLHFVGAAELDALNDVPNDLLKLMDFDAYDFGHLETHECAYNWKTFVEFYLEDYHVAPFHPGLGRFVSCDDLQWTFGRHWCVQTVGFHKGLSQPGDSDVYRAWHQAVLSYYKHALPPVGAMWFLVYPNVMIEWYPLVLVISTVYPRGPERSVNIVEYYHPRDLQDCANGSEMASLAARAYLETAMEGNQIGERMQAGRRALMSRRTTEAGPYHSPLEDGMQHFHQYLRRVLAPTQLLSLANAAFR